jgi:antitoxin (DNA-binding transcriptional repressor) of toxin-antitoxin stability system
METHISATEASRTFSEIVDRVHDGGEHFVVERGGEPVCRIEPVGAPKRCTGADLAAVFSSLPRLDPDYLDTVEKLTRRQRRPPGLRWPR